jgi:hypothetical protein
VAALPCIQHILDANRLTWSGVGHHADCQFASFIHASQQREPTWDLIIDTRRKCRNWLRLHPSEKQKRHGSAYHQEAPLFSQGAIATLWCVVVAALRTHPSLLVCAERLPAPKLQVCHLFAVVPRNPRFTRMLRLRGGSSSGEDKEEEMRRRASRFQGGTPTIRRPICFGKDECKHGSPSPGAFKCV